MTSLLPIRAFCDFVKENSKENMRVAEVGVFDGCTTFGYADIVKENNGHLYLIDWFKGWEGYTLEECLHGYREDGDPLYNQVKKEIEDRGLSDYTTILYGRSHDMSSFIEDDSLDICFIDGDHTYAGCLSDIKDYYPKVKHGGYLCGHDCEDINISHLFRPEDMFVDFIRKPGLIERGINTDWHGVHPGVITAVYENFKDSVEIRQDKKGQGLPIWIKKIDKKKQSIPRFIK
jgi:hypothetical protein